MRRQDLPLCMAAKVSELGLTLSSSPYLRLDREQFSFQMVCFTTSPDPMACGQYIHENTSYRHMYQCNKPLFMHMGQSSRLLFRENQRILKPQILQGETIVHLCAIGYDSLMSRTTCDFMSCLSCLFVFCQDFETQRASDDVFSKTDPKTRNCWLYELIT